jgi:hypothetical protein
MEHHQNKHAPMKECDTHGHEKSGHCDKPRKIYMKFCPISLGLALGLVYALNIFIMAWLETSAQAHGNAEVLRMSGVAFANGFVTAFVFGLIYNGFLCCWKCKSKCKKCGSRCCKC